MEIQVPRLPCKSACGQSKGNSLCTCAMKYSQFFLLRTSKQLTVFSGRLRCPFYGGTCPENDSYVVNGLTSSNLLRFSKTREF